MLDDNFNYTQSYPPGLGCLFSWTNMKLSDIRYFQPTNDFSASSCFYEIIFYNIILPVNKAPSPLHHHIIISSIMNLRTNSSLNQLFIFGMVCVKSNLCRMGAGRPRNPLQPQRRKNWNVTLRGQRSPLLGYRGSCTRAGPGHRSVGSLIGLCPGACRHSPQFVKRHRVTPEGLSWLPWPNTGLKHYQPPHDSLSTQDCPPSLNDGL